MEDLSKRGPRGKYKKRKKVKSNDKRLKENNPEAGKAAVEARRKVKADEKLEQDAKRMLTELDNPFEIKTDIELRGTRGGDLGVVEKLIESVLKLQPGNKKESVIIPINVCKIKSEAVNLCNKVKKVLAEEDDTKGVVITVRALFSADGETYMNTRIWRIK